MERLSLCQLVGYTKSNISACPFNPADRNKSVGMCVGKLVSLVSFPLTKSNRLRGKQKKTLDLQSRPRSWLGTNSPPFAHFGHRFNWLALYPKTPEISYEVLLGILDTSS